MSAMERMESKHVARMDPHPPECTLHEAFAGLPNPHTGLKRVMTGELERTQNAQEDN